MTCALLIDFGSTFTKLRAVDLGTCRIIATAQAASTVTSDVNVGLDAALARMAAQLGSLPRFQYRLASSSAAGGLRMATVGLVRELTAEAARQAALGAGAKLVGSFAYRLTAADMRRLEELEPDLLLLCGGTDGGNSEVILRNAGAARRKPARLPDHRGGQSRGGRRGGLAPGCRGQDRAGRRERHAGIQRAVDRARAQGDPRALHGADRPRQGHRPGPGQVRPRADAHAGGGAGGCAAPGGGGRRPCRHGRPDGGGPGRRHHRRAFHRQGRAHRAGRAALWIARAACQAHRGRRPGHALQRPDHRRGGGHRKDRSRRRPRRGAGAGAGRAIGSRGGPIAAGRRRRRARSRAGCGGGARRGEPPLRGASRRSIPGRDRCGSSAARTSRG